MDRGCREQLCASGAADRIQMHEAYINPRPIGYQPIAQPAPPGGPAYAYTSHFPANPSQMASRSVRGIEKRHNGPVPCEWTNTKPGYVNDTPPTNIFASLDCNAVLQATVDILPTRVSPGILCMPFRD